MRGLFYYKVTFLADYSKSKASHSLYPSLTLLGEILVDRLDRALGMGVKKETWLFTSNKVLDASTCFLFIWQLWNSMVSLFAGLQEVYNQQPHSHLFSNFITFIFGLSGFFSILLVYFNILLAVN